MQYMQHHPPEVINQNFLFENKQLVSKQLGTDLPLECGCKQMFRPSCHYYNEMLDRYLLILDQCRDARPLYIVQGYYMCSWLHIFLFSTCSLFPKWKISHLCLEFTWNTIENRMTNFKMLFIKERIYLNNC